MRKAALSAKKRKEVEISKIIDSQLPLEYRGGDLVRVPSSVHALSAVATFVSVADEQDARVVMEQVIGKLMDAENGLGSECLNMIAAHAQLPALSRRRRCYILV